MRKSASRPERFRFPPVNAVPTWAAPLFRLAELRQFYRAVEDELVRRGCWFEAKDGYIVAHLPTGDIAQCGLYNIGVRCAAARPADYPALVQEHFRRCLGERPAEPAGEVSFAEVRPHVKVRLYPDAFLRGREEHAVRRRLGPDLNAVVVVDYPHMAAGLEPAMLRKLGATEEEAFTAAIGNCRDADVTREPMQMEAAEGFALLGQDHYVTSQVFHLDRHLPPVCLAGALVGLPNRHQLLVYPIVPETLPVGLVAMAELTRRAYREPLLTDSQELRLCERLFWAREGELTHLPVATHGQEAATLVPPEFIERILAASLPHRGARA